MPYEAVRSITLTPIAANLVNANRFIAVSTAGEVDEAVNAGDAIGVSLEASAASSGVAINVALLDGAKIMVESGAAVTAGTRVMSDATGRAITATGATARTLGFALTASGAAGELITIVGLKAAGEFVA